MFGVKIFRKEEKEGRGASEGAGPTAAGEGPAVPGQPRPHTLLRPRSGGQDGGGAAPGRPCTPAAAGRPMGARRRRRSAGSPSPPLPAGVGIKTDSGAGTGRAGGTERAQSFLRSPRAAAAMPVLRGALGLRGRRRP